MSLFYFCLLSPVAHAVILFSLTLFVFMYTGSEYYTSSEGNEQSTLYHNTLLVDYFDPKITNLSSKLYTAEKIYQKTVTQRLNWIATHNANDSSKVNPWNMKTLTHIWNYFPPTFNCPFMKERVGRIGHGGKWICGLELYEYKCPNNGNQPPEECVIYIFGGDDLSVEKEFVKRTDCKVFIFDRKSNKAFPHPRVEVVRNVVISDENDKSKGESTLYNILKENDHGWLEILVMDIGGSRELKVLEQITEEFDILPFGQVQVEIHLPGQNEKDKGAFTIFQKFKRWFERLEQRGLRPFSAEANLFQGCISNKNVNESSNRNVVRKRPTVVEYSFINIRGKHLLVTEV